MKRLASILVAALFLSPALAQSPPNNASVMVPNGGGGGAVSPGGSSGQIQINNGSGGFGSLPAGQLPGTATNDSAAAGDVGEFMSATCSAQSLVSGTAANCASLNLTAGDWDVSFAGSFTAASSTTASYLATSIGSTSSTLNTSSGAFWELATGGANSLTFSSQGLTPSFNAGAFRVSLASTTPYYGVCQSAFAVSTMSCSGLLRARRVR